MTTEPTQFLSSQEHRPLLRQFLELVDTVEKENPSATDIQALRAMLQQHPELWRLAGDLAYAAALSLVQKLSAPPHIAESLKSSWHAIKDELGYHTASPLERQLIEQIVLCWLHLNIIDLEYTSIMAQPAISTPDAIFWEKRLSAAQRRYVRACDALVRIRKITRTTPALQLNIATQGGQQINMLGAGPQHPPSSQPGEKSSLLAGGS